MANGYDLECKECGIKTTYGEAQLVQSTTECISGGNHAFDEIEGDQ